mgnify:CR=1 FL=1
MKNKKYYLLSFLTPCILMILLYITVGVIGGNKNILTVDLADQYVAFFNALKNILNGTIGPFYSFSKTLGGNMLGIITYYLISPFNIIILLFDRIDIPKFILIINILKISCAGLTSYIYFNKTFKNNDLTSLAFSIIYSMMSYNIVYSQNIMWLDGVILLPIIFLGIDKLIEKKPTLFYISLTISIICNYYIGYMSCIASLIYFIYKDYLKENKIVIKNILNFIKILLLSVLTSSVILIPSILSLLSGKASGILQEFIPNQKFAIFDIITRFYIGTFKNSDLEGGCPNIYISLITLVLVIYYFFNKNIKKQEKKASLILLSIFIISFMFYPIDVIWHAFKHPYGFPFRYSFIFDFIMLIIAYKSIIKLDDINKIFIKKFIIYSFIVTLIVDKFLYSSTMYYKAFGTFALLIIYLMYLNKNKTIKKSILLLIIAEMFINSFLIVINIKYQDKTLYENFITNTGYIIDNLNKESFYRLEKDYSYSTNDELLLNYNGISHFSSVYEGTNNELLKQLGIFNRFYITNYNGSTPVTNSLFNIKYLLSEKQINYYKKIDTYKDINTYENIYNLSLGFMVNKNLLKLELEDYEPFENQNNILKSMDNNIEDVFIEESPTMTLNNLKIDETSKNLTYKKINKNKSASIIFELNQNNDGILYAYFGSKANKKVDILLNGESIIDITDQNNYYYNILELGTFNQNQTITLEIELLEDTLKLEDYMFYTLDLNKFNNAINILNQDNQLQLIEYNSDYIKAKINVEEDNQVLYTSIPYDKGFEITVDGKNEKAEKALNTLLAINLEKGNHEITIKYVPRGLKIGSIFSLIGLVLFIIKKRKDH